MSDLKITVDVSGLQRIIQQEPKRVDAWLRSVATEMVSDIKLSFNSGPKGREYKRRKKYHVASAPGHPPNVDTGTLRASIKSTPAGHLKYHISDGVHYGTFLEHGTARMAARPFMAPVFHNWEQKIERDAKENLNLE
jgi:HK97 gp10 family phage protein